MLPVLHHPWVNPLLNQWKDAFANIEHTFRGGAGKGPGSLKVGVYFQHTYGMAESPRKRINSLVFIKVGINIMAMRSAKTTERTVKLGENQFTSSCFFTTSLGGWICNTQSI